MNKRKTKKAMTKYMHGRHLTGREKACFRSVFPTLNFDEPVMMNFTRVMELAKATFEDMAHVLKVRAVPAFDALGAAIADCAEQIRASMPTAEEWARARSTLQLGYSDWQLQMPLYRWGS